MKLSSTSLWRVFFSVLALIALSVCGGKSPSQPGPATSPPVNTGPTPSPTPTADPPVSASCVRIGYGTEALKCPMQVAQFQNEVDQAIRTLQHERPEIFNGNYIQSVGSYYVGLIRILDQQGICAGYDGEELAVKTDNTSNEQYDVETSTGQVRFGPDVQWTDRVEYSFDESRAASFYQAIRRYYPGLPDGALAPGFTGVRAKIAPVGAAAPDFEIQGPAEHGVLGLVNLYGIESPGLTSVLALSDYVRRVAGC